jgi:hypothetical protein
VTVGRGLGVRDAVRRLGTGLTQSNGVGLIGIVVRGVGEVSVGVESGVGDTPVTSGLDEGNTGAPLSSLPLEGSGDAEATCAASRSDDVGPRSAALDEGEGDADARAEPEGEGFGNEGGLSSPKRSPSSSTPGSKDTVDDVGDGVAAGEICRVTAGVGVANGSTVSTGVGHGDASMEGDAEAVSRLST